MKWPSLYPTARSVHPSIHGHILTMLQVVAIDISPIMELGDMPENLEQEVGREQVQNWIWCDLSLIL